MQPTLTVDTREWTAAAKLLAETSSRTAVDFINGQGINVASLAIKLTHHADASKIERQLGAIARSVSFKKLTRGKNKGKTRTVKGDYVMASEDTLAHRILLVRKKLTGRFGVGGETMDEMAHNLIRARIISIHFIRAGWIPALRHLWNIVRQKPRKSVSAAGAKQRGVEKGGTHPATKALSQQSVMQCEIWNSALNTFPEAPSGKGNPMKTARQGLEKALAASAKDMLEELARRLNPDFKRVSAK